MIIRRLIENIRAQNWFVVWIELLIVVFGVFIGIQVSNWNEARLDLKQANSYLERIHADIVADIEGYEDRLAFWGSVSEYGVIGLAFADSGDVGDCSDWDLLLAYFQASQVAEFYTTRTTYDELKSGGELGLIQDLSLRNALAHYYTNADNPAMTERPAYREQVRGIIPLQLQRYIWEHCYASDELGKQVLLECDAPTDAGDLAEIVAAISSNKSLMQQLRYWMSTMHVVSIIGRDRTSSAKAIRDAVGSKIN